MARNRHQKPRRRGRAPRPSPPPAPAPPPGRLARVLRWAARMAAFLGAGGEELLRWFAAAYLRRLVARSASGVDVDEEGRGGGAAEAADGTARNEELVPSAAAVDGEELDGEDRGSDEDGGGDEDGAGDDADATTPVEVELPPTGASSEGATTAAAAAPRASAPRKHQAAAGAGRNKSNMKTKAARGVPVPPRRAVKVELHGDADATAITADGEERGGEGGAGDADARPVEMELPPPGARSEGATIAAPGTSAPRKQAAAGHTKSRTNTKKAARCPPVDPFEDGYHIALLFREGQDRDDKVALSYAKFCRCRALKLGDKKNREELCHVCYFSRGIIRSFQKNEMEKHCENDHNGAVFVCKKEGCVVRCETLREVGLHDFYLHKQRRRDWWRLLLQQHGFDC